MREFGGYIELDSYHLPMLHEEALALNCGRNCLAYLIKVKKIKKILLPKFLCASVSQVCKKANVEIEYYSIDSRFQPLNISLKEDEWIYLVNYYGQLSNTEIKDFEKRYKRIIVDNSQAYFQLPVDGIDTLYTCRKYFGVADGAFLYTDTIDDEELPMDISYERMRFLLGRYETTASEFYNEYSRNNQVFAEEPIKKMSKLTNNLLHAIDYEKVEKQRTDNFAYLSENLCVHNKLQLKNPKGAFMYPLYMENGQEIRALLQRKKIYIPTLWPDVFKLCEEHELEYEMAKNILPIPVDQRYTIEDMKYMIDEIMQMR